MKETPDYKKPEYNVYRSMKQRCLNPNLKSYKYYGQKGIAICDAWKKSFKNFYKDMGPRPEGFFLDRIDCKGNYSPENCRWADKFLHANNKTVVTNIVFKKTPGVCIVCGNLTHTSRIYCSQNCSKYASDIKVKTNNNFDLMILAFEKYKLRKCVGCGSTEMMSKRHTCGKEECRKIAHKIQRKVKWRETHPLKETKCRICAQPFRTSKNVFCGQACAKIDNLQRLKEKYYKNK